MKKSRFSLVILLIVGFTFAQEQVINQSEKLDILAIEQKAKADAKTDFNALRKAKWSGGSCITSWVLVESIPGGIIGLTAPFVAANSFQVNLPKYRELELSSKSSEYQNIYHPVYIKEVKKQRRNYSLVGPASCSLGILFFLFTDGTCFSSGTDITMADGSYKHIEDLEVGDPVLSYNFEKQKTEPDEVLELYSPMNDNMMEMKFSDGTIISSTFDHPYYVKDKGWSSLKPDITKELLTNITEVGQLEEGDICYILKDGELTEVVFLGSQRLTTLQRTYTIKKLKKNNAFFAGGVLVGVETVKEMKNISLKSHLNRFYSKYDKSIIELSSGAGGGILLGAVGLNMIEDSYPGESLESGFGMAAGLVLGSSIGVWLAGELMEDKGSLTGAFLGSVAGPALFILVDASLGYPMIGYSVILGSFFSPLGATIGYALSRPEKPPQTGSILNIDNNTAKLEIPSPTIILSGNKVIEEYQINMIKSQF